MLKTLTAKHRGLECYYSIDYNLSNSTVLLRHSRERHEEGKKEFPQDDSIKTIWIGEVEELRNGCNGQIIYWAKY